MRQEIVARETRLCNHHYFKIFINQEMLSRIISSLQHPFVKYAVKLRSDKSFRHEEQKVLICGTKLVKELSASHQLKVLIHTESFSDKLKAEKSYIVSDEIMKKVTGMQSPEPVAALIDLPKEADLSKCSYLLILDRLSDPGNLGTLLRTALALGWQGAFLLDTSCDPYNEKAIRAAKGATFRLPIQTGTWDTLREILSKGRYQTYVADLNGDSYNKISCKPPLALVLGSESHGPSHVARNNFTPISITMPGPMESLNVASAGAILLQHLRGSV